MIRFLQNLLAIIAVIIGACCLSAIGIASGALILHFTGSPLYALIGAALVVIFVMASAMTVFNLDQE